MVLRKTEHIWRKFFGTLAFLISSRIELTMDASTATKKCKYISFTPSSSLYNLKTHKERKEEPSHLQLYSAEKPLIWIAQKEWLRARRRRTTHGP
jgi:hypothetical protein